MGKLLVYEVSDSNFDCTLCVNLLEELHLSGTEHDCHETEGTVLVCIQ
jgi:hypothetical protein